MVFIFHVQLENTDHTLGWIHFPYRLEGALEGA